MLLYCNFTGKEGLITSQCQWESEAGPAPGAVTVIWQGPEDESEIYRVGYQGKVDLECIEYAEMGGYYPDHLPVLGKGIHYNFHMTNPKNV